MQKSTKPMSEQAKILAQLQDLIMAIMKTGTATAEQGSKIDALEAQLQKQKCYRESKHPEYAYQGEEIAGLLSQGKQEEAIDKMYTWKITADDFFGFIGYHDEDEEYVDIFTDAFITDVSKAYKLKCESK